MQNFVWETPARVHFGKGAIEELPEEVARFGRRVLLAYGGGSIKRIGLYDKIRELLKDCEIVELTGIEPNPRVESAREGAKLCREHDVDVIVSVGGGSVLDCSKLVAAAAKYDGEAWDLVEKNELAGECLPIIAVMTLAATGSELDAGAVISNLGKKRKLPFMHGPTFPKAAFLDPTYSFTVPAWHTACGASDILSHVMEQYFVLDANPIADGFCETMMRVVVEETPVALAEPDNYDARAALMWASSWGCNGLLSLGNGPSAWACHAIEHEISAYYDVTHGAGLAVVTPRWLRRSMTAETAPRIAHFGARVFDLAPTGDVMEDAERAVRALEAFYAKIGMPADMEALGVPDTENVDAMAEGAFTAFPLHLAMKPLEREDVKAILLDAFRK